ncbi:hypothetical protein AC578_2148 [Pseudocercospora eumusae]|uniref:Uncharacterized protein n=1 Tax=Pseudocercospora eumusae TaxID=321146 RepID=A0A139HH86_9PEZI|nr:hypothetical protein AC578_2148 [Pseudocercospora eumusae]
MSRVPMTLRRLKHKKAQIRKRTLRLAKKTSQGCPLNGLLTQPEMFCFPSTCAKISISTSRDQLPLASESMGCSSINTATLLTTLSAFCNILSSKSDVFEKNDNQVRAGSHTEGFNQIMVSGHDRWSPSPVPYRKTRGRHTYRRHCSRHAGELLARWTNYNIESTVDRVVEPPTQSNTQPARCSIPYSCHPHHDSMIHATLRTHTAENPIKYEPVNCGRPPSIQ